MLFRVLGPVEVDTGHAVLAPSGLRRRALLTALLLRPGQIVPAPRLVEAVWGEDPPGHPDNALQSVVARVRRDLGPAGPLLVTGPVGYGLHLRDARIDADLFEQDCRAARAAAETDPATAVALYDRALGRWRGPAYGEFAESFARPAAVRLAELRRTAAADRADALLRAGAVDEAVAAAGDLAAADPLAERPVVVLMRALAAAGRTADALAAYRHHVAHLRDELGLDPPAGLRALHERILRAEPVTPAPAARPRTPVTSPPRLTPLTGFVGRDEERAGLARDLDTHRLVTVVGVGGVGKTTLARAVAADHPTAVVCELAEVTRPDEVAGAVGDALGFPSLEAALMGLGADPRLLLLDNCEHVLDPAASAVGALLDTCPGLTVLATSREPLGLPGEQVVPLSPLPLPEGDDPARLLDSPSAALLLTRAREAGSAIVLDDPDTATAVAELCRRLDGLPLALELAAARTRSMTPAEILAHLDRRLDLLRRTRERGPQRHRSLETAIAWSYDRLPASTQRFFARLGVFSGRFTAEEAHAVAGEPADDVLRTADHLDHLVGQSMLT
ncbi:MAG TPA: BTAD domain-containing putative transcriptional regulator, partial [Pseudonocardia sp.]|nr:BTAD domain-containing putative transcriptional regulator [Pseudonocardia sp.]